jgi:putative ABC transport system permease protein
MTNAVIQSLLGRKLRTVLAGLAVVFGVAMVSGTFVLTDTVKKAFNSIFEGSYQQTGAVISGKEVVKGSTSGKATVPASLLVKVKGLPRTGAAAGQVFSVTGNTDLVNLYDRRGKQIGNSNSVHFGWGIDSSQPRFNPLTLVRGKWAASPNEVVVDNFTFKDQHYRVGDTITAAGDGPKRTFKIAGAARFGDVTPSAA